MWSLLRGYLLYRWVCVCVCLVFSKILCCQAKRERIISASKVPPSFCLKEFDGKKSPSTDDPTSKWFFYRSSPVLTFTVNDDEDEGSPNIANPTQTHLSCVLFLVCLSVYSIQESLWFKRENSQNRCDSSQTRTVTVNLFGQRITHKNWSHRSSSWSSQFGSDLIRFSSSLHLFIRFRLHHRNESSTLRLIDLHLTLAWCVVLLTRVSWGELHLPKNSQCHIPFLRHLTTIKLSSLWIHLLWLNINTDYSYSITLNRQLLWDCDWIMRQSWLILHRRLPLQDRLLLQELLSLD